LALTAFTPAFTAPEAREPLLLFCFDFDEIDADFDGCCLIRGPGSFFFCWTVGEAEACFIFDDVGPSFFFVAFSAIVAAFLAIVAAFLAVFGCLEGFTTAVPEERVFVAVYFGI